MDHNAELSNVWLGDIGKISHLPYTIPERNSTFEL